MKEEAGEIYMSNIGSYGTGTWILWKMSEKHLARSEQRCWRRME
jgi:hypothetical protein